MLELERKADSQRRENDLAGATQRASGRRRSSFKFKKSENDKNGPARNFSTSSSGSTSGSNQVASYRIRHGLSTTESSGYSSINFTDDLTNSKMGDSTKSEQKSKSKRNFAQFVKTNPVARKLKLLAPGDSYSDLDSRLRVAKWYHQGLPK